MHKHINTLDAKINIFWKSNKNEKIRLYKWITCETEESEQNLEDRFIANEEEQEKHDLLNWQSL